MLYTLYSEFKFFSFGFSQLAKLHQLSMQQGLSPIAQPASTIIPGMYGSSISKYLL